MNSKDNAKEIFLKLESSAKDEVRKKISEKFGVSIDTVKIHWIYNGNTPPENKKEVLQIIREVAKNQVQELQQLIDV